MDRLQREQQLYLEALEFESADERSAFLHRECREDQALLQSVQNLLERQSAAHDFLEDPAITLRETVELDIATGTTIGRYKLLEKIGEGGMGVVYMAEQTEPVIRKVALKIIKLGMDTKQVIARFEAERQALAMMDHPNIARVFDGGATEGRLSSRPELHRKGGTPAAQKQVPAAGVPPLQDSSTEVPRPQPLSHPMGEGGRRPGEGPAVRPDVGSADCQSAVPQTGSRQGHDDSKPPLDSREKQAASPATRQTTSLRYDCSEDANPTSAAPPNPPISHDGVRGDVGATQARVSSRPELHRKGGTPAAQKRVPAA